MYIKFNHSNPNITLAMGITPSVIDEADKTLNSLAHLEKTSMIIEKALEIFKGNDLAIAYILMKVGYNIARLVPETKKSSSSVEE